MSLTNHEYPDPPIAAYIEHVFGLAARVTGHPDADALSAAMRRRGIYVLPVRALSSASSWFFVNTIVLIRDPRARQEYRILLRHLRDAGWSVASLQYVVHGLWALRMRDAVTEWQEIYDGAMGDLVPRHRIGL